MEGFFALLLFLILIAAGIAIYFLPTIIAYMKKKENLLSILLLNLLLGWSLIAWVIALVWATSKDSVPQQVVIHNQTESSGK